MGFPLAARLPGARRRQALDPAVLYGYREMAGGVNDSRPTSMTYSDGRVVDDLYGPAGSLDHRISRLAALADEVDGAHLEEYAYLGLGTVAERNHPETGVDRTYVKRVGEPAGDAGDQYAGLDRFGRVDDQHHTQPEPAPFRRSGLLRPIAGGGSSARPV